MNYDLYKLRNTFLFSIYALFSEFVAYSWGDNNKGQLGIGDNKAWTHDPICVDTLKGTAVHR